MIFIKSLQNAFNSPKQESYKQPQLQEQIDITTINKILQLEEVIHEGGFNVGHVGSLLSYYQEMADLFQYTLEPMNHYFAEKVQFLISRPEIIKMLATHESECDQEIVNRLTSMRTTVTNDQLRDQEEKRFNRPFLQQNIIESTPKMRFSVYKKQRAKEMQICIEIADQQQDQKQDLKYLMQQYEELSKEYDHAIKQQLQDQNDALRKRMVRRQKDRSKRNSTSQEHQKAEEKHPQEIQQKNENQISRWKLISQLEESVSFMRHSINKIRKQDSIIV